MKNLTLALLLVTSVSAQAVVLYDNTASNASFTTRLGGESMPAGHFTNNNATDVTLGSVAFLADLDGTSNVKYILADNSGTILDSVVATHADGGLQLYAANVNWTLAAGATYFIGGLVESGTVQIGYGQDYAAQNGLTQSANGNFFGYDTPTFEGTAGASMTWVLDGEPVPEPATMAVLGLGVAAAARRRRKA